MRNSPQGDWKHRIFKASRWSILTEWSAKGLMPLIFVALAKILAPGDFGIVSVSAILLSFSSVIWDAGLSKALVQRRQDEEQAASVVFWTNLALALTVYACLHLSADGVAFLFQDPRIGDVLRIQGLQVFPAAAASVFTALYQRRLDFRVLFWVRLSSTMVLGLASLAFAFLGTGYWSLVIGTMAGAIVQFFLLWILSPWKPSWTYDLSVARQLFSFGAWISLSGLLSWFYLYVDALVVGAYLSTHQLGLYQLGNQLTVMVFSLLLSPFSQVLFSGLSQIQHELDRLRKALDKAAKLMSLICLPLGLALFALRQPIAEVMFNKQWSGVEEVIGIMGISWGIGWLVGAYPDAYRAMGRPDLDTKIMLVSAFFYLPVYLVTAPYGLTVFLWGRLLLSIPSMTFHLYTSWKVLAMGPADFCKRIRSACLTSAILFLVLTGAGLLLANSLPPLARLLVLTTLGILTYGLTLWKLEHVYLRENLIPFLCPGIVKG